MPIPVFRVEKNGNYTTMSNYHLQDKALSLKAKGLLSMLLSLPDSWSYSVRGLAAISREGKDGILSGLQELERYGYLIRKQKRCASGKMGLIEYVIYERPRPRSDSPCPEKPHTEKPDAAFPAPVLPPPDNPPEIKTNQLNTKVTNTNKNNNEEKAAISPPLGKYQNVYLSRAEMEFLKTEFPDDWENRINRLSEYMASTGKHYENHLATIRSWARQDTQAGSSFHRSIYSYDGNESL